MTAAASDSSPARHRLWKHHPAIMLLRLSMDWALFVCCFPVFFYFPMFLYTCLYLCFTHDITKGSSTHALRVGLCLLLSAGLMYDEMPLYA